MIFSEIKNKYPYFYKVSTYLENSCFFYKSILNKLKALNLDYEYCENICDKAFVLSNNSWDECYKNLDRLVLFSLECTRLQIELAKTGKYCYSSFEEVEKHVYCNSNNNLFGPRYLMSLFFSQIFWLDHYKVNMFFMENICKVREKYGRIIEVPVGTGIFLANFLSKNKSWDGFGVDISDLAIDFAKKTLKAYSVSNNNIRLIKEDFYKYEPSFMYDIILCGEFLEHVENPLKVLLRLYSMLNNNGLLFVTVAVYAAAIDHIYLYRNAEEVRIHIFEAGFRIEKELVVNVFFNKKSEDSNTPILYSAVLKKK